MLKFIYLLFLFACILINKCLFAQAEEYSFPKNWSLVNSKKPAGEKTRDTIEQLLSLEICLDQTDAQRKCDIILKNVLGQNYNCEFEYHLLNDSIYSDILVSPCDEKIPHKRKSTGTLLTRRLDIEFMDIPDLEKYLDRPKAIFDSWSLNLARVVKPTDSLVVFVDGKSFPLSRSNSEYYIPKTLFKNPHEVQSFKLVNLNDEQLNIEGSIHFLTAEEKDRVLNYAKALKNISKIDSANKIGLVTNYATYISSEYEFDRENLMDWLGKKEIIF